MLPKVNRFLTLCLCRALPTGPTHPHGDILLHLFPHRLATVHAQQSGDAFGRISAELLQARMRGMSEAEITAACAVLHTIRNDSAVACEQLAAQEGA